MLSDILSSAVGNLATLNLSAAWRDFDNGLYKAAKPFAEMVGAGEWYANSFSVSDPDRTANLKTMRAMNDVDAALTRVPDTNFNKGTETGIADRSSVVIDPPSLLQLYKLRHPVLANNLLEDKIYKSQSLIISIWSSDISEGACPILANSCNFAFGPTWVI